MPRHTSFRFCLDPSVEQERVLSRHVGTARFAFNQALRLHKDARAAAERGPGRDSTPKAAPGVGSDADHPGRDVSGTVHVPWTGFDLINAFNKWKRSEAAGRRFLVDPTGMTQVQVTGLVWQGRVLAQVFEEACVDLGRGLKAFTASRTGTRKGPRVGFPRFRKKSLTGGSFRIRNKTGKGRASVRVGDGEHVRSVTLPKIGVLRVREDTRRLRRMIAKDRARILFVTVSRGANRWWISITVEAADLHPARRHTPPPPEPPLPEPPHGESPHGENSWVGVDRGLHALAVAGSSDGVEVLRLNNPRALRRGLSRLRRLSKAVTRKKKGSRNRKKAVVRLSRHARIRDRRRHVLHQVPNQLVKNHCQSSEWLVWDWPVRLASSSPACVAQRITGLPPRGGCALRAIRPRAGAGRRRPGPPR